MAPAVFEDGQYEYLQKHLRILSGFYGFLKPMDGVTPYRLEMASKLSVDGFCNLYEFWGDTIYNAVLDESRVIINLASKEYSRCIEKYLRPEDHFVTFIFGERGSGDRIVQKGVYCKMARGEMVRYLAENGAEDPEQAKDFNWSGYRFVPERSDDENYVFVK